MHYKSKKKLKFSFIITLNQNYQYIFLLLLFGGNTTTYSLESRKYRETNLETNSLSIASSHDVDGLSNVQFIRPMGGAQIGVSSGFYKASDLFRAAINESVDPCDDFYEFSCGKWIANNKIPDDLSSYGYFSELREKVNLKMKELLEDVNPSTSKSINTLKQIYQSCMDVKTLNKNKLKPLLNKLEEFGYWPILHGNKWNSDSYNLTKLLVQTTINRNTNTFIDFSISLDPKNVSRQLINIDQGGLGLGSSARDYYLNTKRYKKQINAYKLYIKKKIIILSQDANITYNENEIEKNVSEILKLETEFVKILLPEDERRNYTKMYNIRRFSKLSSLFNLIDWNVYFRLLMPQDMNNYFNNDPFIIINELDFLRRLQNLLKKTDKRVIVNYILWRYATTWSYQLDERYDDIQQEFYKSFIGKQTKSPRWKDCSSAAISKMTYTSSAIYVRKHFQKSDRKEALEMVQDLRKAFEDMLETNDWMENKSKKYAIEKANNMLSLIGFPDFIYNDTALDNYYANFTIEKENDYYIVVERSFNWALNKAFHRLLEPVDRSEFGTSSVVINAFYSSVKNAITFPAAILQAPFFDRSFPKAVNYGGIGAIIGHEITHGFDDRGSQFNKNGNLENWWESITHKRFFKRTKCIIDQYSAYEVPNTNLTINGILTQGENIADNGGVKQAFKAYRSYINRLGFEEKRLPGLENYTNDQIFYISYAQNWCGQSRPETAIRQILVDPHSPMRFRVNGVVLNQPEFAKAFNCSKAAKLNPEKRCPVW